MTQNLMVFLRWYAETYLWVCGLAILVAMPAAALSWWAESALATLVITIVPAMLTCLVVSQAASRYRLSVKATVFWSGTAATAACLFAMSIGEDASYLPRWMTVSLHPALIVGGLPLTIAGPAIAYRLGKKQAQTRCGISRS